MWAANFINKHDKINKTKIEKKNPERILLIRDDCLNGPQQKKEEE